MINKFVRQSENDFQDAMESIQENQEIEDSSLIQIFKLFRETVSIISNIKLNFSSFNEIITINDNEKGNYFYFLIYSSETT
jgi:hypothetical protein